MPHFFIREESPAPDSPEVHWPELGQRPLLVESGYLGWGSAEADSGLRISVRVIYY